MTEKSPLIINKSLSHGSADISLKYVVYRIGIGRLLIWNGSRGKQNVVTWTISSSPASTDTVSMVALDLPVHVTRRFVWVALLITTEAPSDSLNLRKSNIRCSMFLA